MIPSKECITCEKLACINIAEGINVYPCTICCRIGNSEDIDKWAPRETNKMKSTSKRIIEVLKEMFTFSDSVNLVAARVTSIVFIPYLCFIAISAIGSEITTSHYTFNGMIFGLLMTIGIWLLGYFSRKPDPNRKGFKKWLKICKLKIQIAILKKWLKRFSDLRKYPNHVFRYRHGQPEVKKRVREWRLELRELKRELKELI